MESSSTSGVSFVSPKVKKQKSFAGYGLFAVEPIAKDELVVDFSTGPGTYLTVAQADAQYNPESDYMLQVGDDLYFAATNSAELEDADFVNHSCDPACGIRGSLQLVALRDIKVGEEITFDYAMNDSSDSFEMACACGAKNCRHKITGNDWKLPELQAKYKGYFSDYLAKKISKLSK